MRESRATRLNSHHAEHDQRCDDGRVERPFEQRDRRKVYVERQQDVERHEGGSEDWDHQSRSIHFSFTGARPGERHGFPSALQ
jgi:hypothetical protein